MYGEELKMAQTRARTLGAGLAEPCRESTTKEMLMRKADGLRAEALRLESLARDLPEGLMPGDSERTLRDLVAAGLFR